MAEAVRYAYSKAEVKSKKKKSKEKLTAKEDEEVSKTFNEENAILDVICDTYDDVDILQDNHSTEQILESSEDVCDRTIVSENNSEIKSSDITEANFLDLNKELNNMKPYLQVHKQLHQLKLNKNDNEISADIPSAPQVNEKDFKMLECLSPNLSKPNHLMVRQRCLDVSKDDQSDSQVSDLCSETINIKPYTELQLLALYYNVQLEEKDVVINSFLECEKNTSQNKFYEIVLNYRRARTSLLETEKDIKTFSRDYEKQKESVWTFEKCVITEEGTCEDDQLLSAKCSYEIATYQPSIAKHISKQLKQIRERLYDSHSLHIYMAEISKLQVENYLNNIISICKVFKSLPKNGPVHCQFNDHAKDIAENIKSLKECISALMSFCRRNIKDIVFLRDVKAWLSDAVAILLRVASSQDHLFIVNHLMRCPIGVGDWGSQFIQVIPPIVHKEQDLFGSQYLDHLITVLSILMDPVKERKNFLRHFKGAVTSPEKKGDCSWIVLDSSGEDEEDTTEMFHYFGENDVIQFLNQIPFKEMFKHILLTESMEESVKYDIEKATDLSIMKLFAFCTQLLKIFRQGLKTYQQARFKGVVKRLSRLIRHSVHYVTDHFKGFLEIQQSNKKISVENNAMILRLQVEYDEFFENAVKTVFLSPRCGAWQFLAVIPYDCVSLNRLWKIAYKLHIGYSNSEASTPGEEIEDWQSLLSSDDTRGRFHDRLGALGDSESYFLLTALANMAILRSDKEIFFIECIVSNLFDVTFVNAGLRTTMNRTGRDLFLAIAESHAFTISTLISELQENLNSVGSLALYLFRFLPLDNWIPTEEDLQCLSFWLLYTPAPSLESNLARVVFAKMNWGFSSSRVDSLALPRAIHERMAVVIVEVAMKLSSKLGQGNLISEGLKQVTSVVYAPSAEEVFSKWCWSMLNQLHLHQMDQPDTEVRAMLANQSQVLRGIGDPFVTPSLEPLKNGLTAKHPLSVFAALLMSSWGHSVPEICNHVPENLELLVSSGHSEAALTVLSLIVPLFFNQREDLVSDTKFVNILQCILASDQTYVNLAKSYISSDARGKIVSIFRGLILDQIFNFKRFNLESPSPVIKFWIDFLVLVPNWTNNLSVLKLVDILCQASITDPKAMQLLKEVFTEQQKMVCEKNEKRGLGGLLTWVSSGSGCQISLLEGLSAAEVPWFALCVLICEIEEEIRSGLWKNLLKYLHNNPSANLETALKDVCADLQLGPVSSNSLVLYRLGQQLLDLPSNHIAFPATAQIFLMFHLARTPPQTGQYNCSSVIYKFYEGFINGNFLKKIKNTLSDCLTYWKSELAKQKNAESGNKTEKADEKDADKQNRRRIRFVTKLVSTLSAMSSWMEETRFYETGLYVPALPPQLMPKKLLQVFQENLELWPELINDDCMMAEMEIYIRCWSNHRKYTFPSSPPSSGGSSPSHSRLSDSNECHRSRENLTPAESIVKRLGEYDPPKPPPLLPSIIHKYSRSREKPLNRESVLYDIDRFTNLIVRHSRTMLLKSKEMCAFDCVYIELLPQLWTNPVLKKVLSVKCQPKKNSKVSECSGPASIVVEFREKRINESIKAKLEQNREHYLSLYNFTSEGAPLQVCEAALQLEDLVSNVVSWHKNVGMTADEAASLVTYGRELFYHFVQLTSEETNSYPPAKQLITSCADILGQEFLRDHQDCQESLALQVLQSNPDFGVLLSPHFTPMATPISAYLSSYAALYPSVPNHPDLCFMLLSKFEMESWLRVKKIDRVQRSKLIKCVCHSLSSIIAMGEESTIMCLELYRVHLRALLSYNFPEHFAEILMQLLEMSVSSNDCGDVRRNLWFDFLNTLSKGVVEFTPEMTSQEIQIALRQYAQRQILLSPAMVKDTIALLSSHFVHQRVEYGLYGLFSKYKSDVTPVVMLLGMISFTYIMSAPMTSQQTGESLSQEIWLNLEGLWTAWVAPLGGKARASCPQWIQELTLKKSLLLPWTPGDVTAPAKAVGMFASTLSYFHDTSVGSRVLSRLLDYYHITYASSAVKDHILSVVHSQLAALSWHHLEPTLKDLEIFSKIMDQYLPECHSFVGNIFTQISWEKVVQNFLAEFENSGEIFQNPETKISDIEGGIITRSPLAKLHVLLLNILVRVSMEPSVRQNGLLHPLLLSANSFQWHVVDAKSFEAVLNWFVMSCDPRIALEMDNRNPIDVSLIQLLHVAAGYARDAGSPRHISGSLKRCLLVRSICRLLTTAATRHKALLSARRDLFGSTYSKIMTHMEVQVVQGLPEASKFEEGFCLSSEAINLIGGGASPPALQEVCRDHLLNWLQGSHPSREFLMSLVAAISKGVLHLHHRSPLIEECIAAIFNFAESLGEKERLSWFDVVRVLSFPVTNPTSMLTFAAQENHLLVIYIHTKWRIHIRNIPSTEYLCVLGNLVDILELIYPDECCENWLLLLIGETIDLIVTEIRKGEDYNTIWRHSNKLSDFLTSWGEDRSSSGILAAIGLGKRSPLSSRVRLVCKCLSTFLKSQLLAPGFFCSINEHKRSIDDDAESDASYNSSLKLLHRLLALRTNATYAPFLTGLNYAIDFTQESRNTILDSGILFDGLLSYLFPKGAALLQLRTDVSLGQPRDMPSNLEKSSEGSILSPGVTLRRARSTEEGISTSQGVSPRRERSFDSSSIAENYNSLHVTESSATAPSAPSADFE